MKIQKLNNIDASLIDWAFQYPNATCVLSDALFYGVSKQPRSVEIVHNGDHISLIFSKIGLIPNWEFFEKNLSIVHGLSFVSDVKIVFPDILFSTVRVVSIIKGEFSEGITEAKNMAFNSGFIFEIQLESIFNNFPIRKNAASRVMLENAMMIYTVYSLNYKNVDFNSIKCSENIFCFSKMLILNGDLDRIAELREFDCYAFVFAYSRAKLFMFINGRLDCSMIDLGIFKSDAISNLDKCANLFVSIMCDNSQVKYKVLEIIADELCKNFKKTRNIQKALPTIKFKNAASFIVKIHTEDLEDLQFIGQFDRKFLIYKCCHKDLILLIDQHACDERIKYESLCQIFANANATFVELAQKIKINVPRAPINKEFLQKFGLNICIEQDKAMLTGAHPLLFKWFILKEKVQTLNQLVYELIEMVSFEPASNPVMHEKILKKLACSAAIRFGTIVCQKEAKNLADKLRKCRNQFQCAHGRNLLYPIPLKQPQIDQSNSFI